MFKEEVEGGDALRQTPVDGFPLGAGNDARQQVVGPNTFGSLVIPVDGEGDALIEECFIGCLLSLVERFGGPLQQTVLGRLVMMEQPPISGPGFLRRGVQYAVPQRGVAT